MITITIEAIIGTLTKCVESIMEDIRHLRILHHPSIVNLIIHVSTVGIVLVATVHGVLQHHIWAIGLKGCMLPW